MKVTGQWFFTNLEINVLEIEHNTYSITVTKKADNKLHFVHINSGIEEEVYTFPSLEGFNAYLKGWNVPLLSESMFEILRDNEPFKKADYEEHPLTDLYQVGHRFSMSFEVTDNLLAVRSVMKVFHDKAELEGIKCLSIAVRDLQDEYGKKINNLTKLVNGLIDEGDMATDGLADYVVNHTGYQEPTEKS